MNGLQFPEQLQVLYVYKNEGSHLIRGNKTNWVGSGDNPHRNSAVV